MEDLTLQLLFSPEEYSSIQGLPCLGALQFRLILEGVLPKLLPLTCGERLGGTYHPNWSKEESGNHQFSNSHHQWGRRGGIRHGDDFCHPHQAKIEACDALSTLHKCDSSEVSMVVRRTHSNTPYIPRGTCHSLYLDVGSLSGGASSTQFPLYRLHLHWQLPFTRSKLLLPCEEGDDRLEMYPHLPEILWESSAEEHPSFQSNLPVSPHASSSTASGGGHSD